MNTAKSIASDSVCYFRPLTAVTIEEHSLKSGYVTVNLSLKQDRKSICAALSVD